MKEIPGGHRRRVGTARLKLRALTKGEFGEQYPRHVFSIDLKFARPFDPHLKQDRIEPFVFAMCRIRRESQEQQRYDDQRVVNNQTAAESVRTRTVRQLVRCGKPELRRVIWIEATHCLE